MLCFDTFLRCNFRKGFILTVHQLSDPLMTCCVCHTLRSMLSPLIGQVHTCRLQEERNDVLKPLSQRLMPQGCEQSNICWSFLVLQDLHVRWPPPNPCWWDSPRALLRVPAGSSRCWALQHADWFIQSDVSPPQRSCPLANANTHSPSVAAHSFSDDERLTCCWERQRFILSVTLNIKQS